VGLLWLEGWVVLDGYPDVYCGSRKCYKFAHSVYLLVRTCKFDRGHVPYQQWSCVNFSSLTIAFVPTARVAANPSSSAEVCIHSWIT
jgi:hypothetical protein